MTVSELQLQTLVKLLLAHKVQLLLWGYLCFFKSLSEAPLSTRMLKIKLNHWQLQISCWLRLSLQA